MASYPQNSQTTLDYNNFKCKEVLRAAEEAQMEVKI